MRNLSLDQSYRNNLNATLSALSETKKQIEKLSKPIREKTKENKDCQLIQSIPGIGFYFSALIKAEIGSIDRFCSPDKLCSYAGLVPSVSSSGGKTYYGHITKCGSGWLRWAFVEGIQTLTKSDSAIGRYYRRIRKNKGRNVAKVATARKLCSIVYYVLKYKEPYNDNRASAKSIRAKAGHSSFGHTS